MLTAIFDTPTDYGLAYMDIKIDENNKIDPFEMSIVHYNPDNTDHDISLQFNVEEAKALVDVLTELLKEVKE